MSRFPSNRTTRAAGRSATAAPPASSRTEPDSAATQAVQVALDRRDNGGEASK